MYALGLDIGTTSLSGAAIDTATGRQLASATVPNDAALPGAEYERLQSPERLAELAGDVMSALAERLGGDPACIGVTGQMHGRLYYDAQGRSVSPLATWEDGRGAAARGGTTPARELSALTGYDMATGYGLTTCYCDMLDGAIPEGAAGMCTIADYLVMRLTGRRRALMHASSAASFGLYDLAARRFDRRALAAASLPAELLPETASGEVIAGETTSGVPVAAAIGDNQAGLYGAAGLGSDIVINIGTSSQLSVQADGIGAPGGLECRPYVGGRYIWLGAGLCGGSAMAELNALVRDVCRRAGCALDAGAAYALMEKAAEESRGAAGIPEVSTLFRGTRENPALRGEIRGLAPGSLSVGKLGLGFYRGICAELRGFYDRLPEEMRSAGRLIVCGNAPRRSAALLGTIEESFGRKAVLSPRVEEAAAGAALIAARAANI